MVKMSTRFATGQEDNLELVEFKPLFTDVVVLDPLRTFRKKYGDAKAASCTELMTNPFAFEGKTVLTHLTFNRMLARDKGFLDGGDKCGVVASGIPAGSFSTGKVEVILGGRVMGMTEVTTPTGVVPFPHLKFIGVETCRKPRCADLLPE